MVMKMAKYKSIHIYKSTSKLMKMCKLTGETHDELVNRLLDMADEELQTGFSEKEYSIEYGDVSRGFKIRFNKNGLNEIFFYNPSLKDWSSDSKDWDTISDSSENKSTLKYLVKFIDEFISDSKNFVLLEMMGDSMNFGDVIIRRVN